MVCFLSVPLKFIKRKLKLTDTNKTKKKKTHLIWHNCLKAFGQIMKIKNVHRYLLLPSPNRSKKNLLGSSKNMAIKSHLSYFKTIDSKIHGITYKHQCVTMLAFFFSKIFVFCFVLLNFLQFFCLFRMNCDFMQQRFKWSFFGLTGNLFSSLLPENF